MYAFKRLALLLTSILLTTGPLWAAGGSSGKGPGGTGGGNISKSTRADLQEVIDHMYETTWEISDSYLMGGDFKITTHVENSDLKSVTSKVLNSDHFSVNTATREYFRNLKFEIVDAPCFEDDEEKDASTPYKKNAPICLSATRLSRYPKSVLKTVLLPIIFHEIAHQFNLGEPEARALQALAELHLKYRTIFLASMRTQLICGTSTQSLTSSQYQDLVELNASLGGKGVSIARSKGKLLLQQLLQCSAEANAASITLKAAFDGNPKVDNDSFGLTAKEKSDLLAFHGTNDKSINFSSITWALSEPSITGYSRKDLDALHLDPQYIMMLGGKAAIKIIDNEVGRVQDKITFEELMN